MLNQPYEGTGGIPNVYTDNKTSIKPYAVILTQPTDPIDTPEQILQQFSNFVLWEHGYAEENELPFDGLMLEFNNSLVALDRHYKAQTEQVLREVIGKDEGYNLNLDQGRITQSIVGDKLRAEQRQRATNLGYKVLESEGEDE